ncbi:hypothetical protein ACFSO7_01055 [Bacillus sp. CGMCC 1.16607]|uniref:hypothetical protein n=1 Tax=Bacillus sp. CGMCC 1.16607 TaxID=3351842 RepID=UPI00363662C9
MERKEIERFFYFPYDDFPEFDPEIWVYLKDNTYMFGYLDYCYWLGNEKDPYRKECITFQDFTKDENDEIHETIWNVHRDSIIEMKWAHEPPIIN